MFLGLRTTIYPAPRLADSKAWFTHVLGIDPYFDEDFYVGYSVNGYELVLNPHADPERGPITYWGVANVDETLARLIEAGTTVDSPVQEVGGAIRVAIVRLPHENGLLGIIENPHFAATDIQSPGPGR